MKQLFVVTLLIITCTALACAQAPALGEPYKLKSADGTVLYLEGSGGAHVPNYVDFDGDGVPDLLVGQIRDGACRIYRNHGTAANPLFKDYTYFHAGGKKAIVPPD